MRKLSDIFAQ